MISRKDAIRSTIELAESYIGYLEKASAKDLDDPKANIGAGNYTKFARDYFPDLQGREWCCMFVFAVFAYNFNTIMAQNILHGCKTAKCSTLYDAMYKNNAIIPIKDSKPGDLIFFHKDKSINHIGIIYKVENDKIHTIEGNTSTGNNVVINSGGGVYNKCYKKDNPRIYGIGRPNWNIFSGEDLSEPIIIKDNKKESKGRINANDVNIRKGPGIKYESIDKLFKNDEIEILDSVIGDDRDKWYKAMLNGIIFYVRSDLVNII